MTAKGAWSDLLPRIGTAVILAGVAAVALWMGGIIFKALLLIVVALMHWELGQMLNAMSRQSGSFAASCAGITFLIVLIAGSWWWALIWMLLGAAVQLLFFYNHKRSGFIVSLAIFFTGFVLVSTRDSSGFEVVFWLLTLVIVTDLGGYFGGRLIGGPKLIPRFSPKKTWSGAITGWVFAVGLSLWFAEIAFPGLSLTLVIGLTIILAIMSQVGDISESALKRACNAKDSSQLLPGHGGLLDRFDGTVGATLSFWALSPFLVGL